MTVLMCRKTMYMADNIERAIIVCESRGLNVFDHFLLNASRVTVSPILTAAKPSEKLSTPSNIGSITIFPDLSLIVCPRGPQ